MVNRIMKLPIDDNVYIMESINNLSDSHEYTMLTILSSLNPLNTDNAYPD